jgi:hypothetical protein
MPVDEDCTHPKWPVRECVSLKLTCELQRASY